MLCGLICLIGPQLVNAQRVQPGKSSTLSGGSVQLGPDARAALDTAVAALQQGSLEDAERAARRAVSAAPRSAVTHNLLGVILDRAGKTEEGYQEFRTAIKLDPSFVSALNNVARHLAERGQTNEAITQFERILQLEPAHVQAHYNLGLLYERSGDFVKSANHFAEARKAEPADPQLALAFLNVAYRANRSAEADAAASLVEKAVGSDASGLFTLANALAEGRQYEQAARLYTRVNEITPHTYEVLYNLGIALYNLDRNEDAAKYLSEAADLNPGPAEAHLRLALIASARNDWTNAIIEFKHVLERDAKNASYHYLLGREYFRIGYWDGAISEYTSAVELEPKEPAYVLARADAYYRKGDWNSAAAAFDHAAMLDPNRSDIEYWQGYAHRAAGNFDRAREHLEKYLVKNPDNVDALASLGYVSIEQGRLEEAEAPLKHALSLDPNNVAVLYDYARLALKERDFAEAVIRLKQVVSRSPSHTAAQYQLFLAYSRLKQTEQAQAALMEFKRLDALEKESTKERMADEKIRIQQALSQLPQ
jgi:tetratricopeptide (TPR) repeat protein